MISAQADTIRQRLTDAALRAYGEQGRAATTRRIAELAGVNEVTLFRHFGSKDALLAEALASCASRALAIRLPRSPANPRAELKRFCAAHLHAMADVRAIIRHTLADFEAHPEAAAVAREVTVAVALELNAYLTRLRQAGRLNPGPTPRAATIMLMSTLLADAITRDCLPEHYPTSTGRAVDAYVDAWLRMIGTDADGGRRGSRRTRSTKEVRS